MKKITRIYSILCISILILIFNPVQKICAQVLPQDSLALVALYDSTNGDSWTNKTNWLSDQPVGNWYGITISENRISQIKLNLNNLVGTIPPAMADLTALTILNLERNTLSGDFPVQVLDLTNLVELNLRNNNINGSIPDDIDKLINLETFYMFNNPLGGSIPESMSNLTNLRNIRLNGTGLEGPIPAKLGNLSNLALLEIGHNALSDTIPSELGKLVNLTGIYLTGNALSGKIPPELGKCVNLRRLFLAANQLTGSFPPELCNIVQLENLQLQGNELAGTIPSQIEKLSKLELLFLYNNQLDGPIPEEILNLQSLRTIRISNNQFNNLPGMAPLAALTELSIQNNKFTFKDIEKNVSIVASFIYSPQDSIVTIPDTTIEMGKDLILMASAGGDNTIYQWIKDDIDIDGANDSVYTITSADLTDAGRYLCRMTNPVASELTLFSHSVIVKVNDPTAIDIDSHSQLPTEFAMQQNYPNPFNPVTMINYQLPMINVVELSIYNLIGQKVATLVNGQQQAGHYQVEWDATGFSTGVYYYQLVAGEYREVKKMILLR